jgi:hypothetical protein
MVPFIQSMMPASVQSAAMLCTGMLVIGVVLWVTGARFSQGLLTLGAVAIGAWAGMRLPIWMNWQVEGMSTAVALSLVLGLIAFWLHEACVGLVLGILSGLWVVVAVGDITAIYALAATTSVDSFPRDLIFPLGAAMLMGLTAALMWPRVGAIALFSMIGSSFMALGALVAMERIDMSLVPTQKIAQVLLMVGLVALGALIQWWQMPRERVADTKTENSMESDNKGAERVSRTI